MIGTVAADGDVAARDLLLGRLAVDWPIMAGEDTIVVVIALLPMRPPSPMSLQLWPLSLMRRLANVPEHVVWAAKDIVEANVPKVCVPTLASRVATKRRKGVSQSAIVGVWNETVTSDGEGANRWVRACLVQRVWASCLAVSTGSV